MSLSVGRHRFKECLPAGVVVELNRQVLDLTKPIMLVTLEQLVLGAFDVDFENVYRSEFKT